MQLNRRDHHYGLPEGCVLGDFYDGVICANEKSKTCNNCKKETETLYVRLRIVKDHIIDTLYLQKLEIERTLCFKCVWAEGVERCHGRNLNHFFDPDFGKELK